MDWSRSRTGAHLVSIIAIIGALLLSACGPSIPNDQAQKEIGAFVLNFIIRQQIGGMANYTESTGQAGVDAPPDANIIVWAPPSGKGQDAPLDTLETAAPLHVWWLVGNHLTEVTADKTAAIHGYRDVRMQQPTTNATSNAGTWGYYEFGILSMSAGNRKAEVYVGVSCGPLCGSGTVYKLERNESGQWQIRGSQMMWIS